MRCTMRLCTGECVHAPAPLTCTHVCSASEGACACAYGTRMHCTEESSPRPQFALHRFAPIALHRFAAIALHRFALHRRARHGPNLAAARPPTCRTRYVLEGQRNVPRQAAGGPAVPVCWAASYVGGGPHSSLVLPPWPVHTTCSGHGHDSLVQPPCAATGRQAPNMRPQSLARL